MSGVKHQIRVHLGLALGTPILGDTKYSYVDQLQKPQHVKGKKSVLRSLRSSLFRGITASNKIFPLLNCSKYSWSQLYSNERDLIRILHEQTKLGTS